MINTDSSLGETLFDCMKHNSNRILQYLADTQETETYGQVLQRCIRVALKLRAEGVNRNDIISTCTHLHMNSCVPTVAALFLGAIATNFDPKLSPLDTIHLLKLVEPKIIFVSCEALPLMEKCLAESKVTAKLVVFGESTKYTEFSEYLLPSPYEKHFIPDHINNNRDGHYTFQQWNNRLAKSTFYWVSGIACFIETVIRGDAQVVCSKFDPGNTWVLLDKYKIIFMFLSTHLVEQFIQSKPTTVTEISLQFLYVAGSPITKQLMERVRKALPNVAIINTYAQTETVGCVCRFDVEDVEQMKRNPSSCGRLRSKYEWKVVDLETEKPLGPYEKGELRLKSDLMMNGYYKIDTSVAFDAEGFLKTGDVVYYDDDECFYIVDRIKEAFKYKGWHILPAMVEEVLLSHPAVREAVVIGIPQEVEGEHPMGIVVLNDGCKLTSQEIQEYVEQRVSEVQKLRAGVKVVNEILRTATGKIRRSDIRKLVLDGKL